MQRAGVVLVLEIRDRGRAGPGGDGDPDRRPLVDLRSWGRVLGQDPALGLIRRDHPGRRQGEAEARRFLVRLCGIHSDEIRHGDLRDPRRSTGGELEDEERDRREQEDGDDAGDPHERTRPVLVVIGGWRAGQWRWRRGRGTSRAQTGVGADICIGNVGDPARVGAGRRGDHRRPGSQAGNASRCPGRAGRRAATGLEGGVEGIGHVRRRGPPIVRVERERLAGDRGEIRRDRRPDGRRVGDRAGQPGEGDRCRAVALPRPDPGEHLVQDDAQAVDVRGGGGLLAARLFRAEVVDRAEGHPRQRHLGLGDRAGDPEVDDLDPAVRADQDVARLHVTMDEASGVCGGEGAGDAGPDARDLARRQRAAPPQDRGEVLPVDQFHDDVRAAAGPRRSRRR